MATLQTILKWTSAGFDDTGCYAIVTYTVSYNAKTNTSTIKLSDFRYRQSGDNGKRVKFTSTVTATATDSKNSQEATTTYDTTGNGGYYVYYPTLSTATLEVKHSPTAGAKKVNISLMARTTSVYYSGGLYSSDKTTNDIDVSSGTYATYTLTLDSNASYTISRTSSPNNATTGTLSNNAVIHYGDVLKISATALTGYNLSSLKVGTTNITSGSSHTVTGNTSITSTKTVKSFLLTLTPDEGSLITTTRTSSPLQNASAGQINNGATIYYNDVIKIEVKAKPTYEVALITANEVPIDNGSSQTVTSNLEVKSLSKVTISSIKMFIHNGTNWEGPYSVSI